MQPKQSSFAKRDIGENSHFTLIEEKLVACNLELEA
jgi:hypothetical protein